MSKGFYTAQDGHVVNILPPVNITGGVTGQPFCMRDYAHASIIIQVGVSAAAFTKINLYACTDLSGDGALSIPYDLYTQETTNGDVLSGRNAITSAGYSPSSNDDIFYVIEIDTAALPQGYQYIQVQLSNGVNSCLASAVAVLSGSRYANDPSQSALV